jgi:subtilisin family serine protease
MDATKAITWLTTLFIALPLVLMAPAWSQDTPTAQESRPYWVFFRDHGPSAHSREIIELARSIPAAAWARRARTGKSMLPDARDLAVWEPYVSEVAQRGCLRHRSRWFNAVSADLSAAAVTAVSNLPFVTGVRPVARAERQSLGPSFDQEGRPLGRVTQPVRRELLETVATWRKTALLDPAGPLGAWDRSLLYGPSYWQLDEIGVPPVHELGYSANRVGFMMIDTGFRKDHDAFAQSDVLAEWDYVFGDGNVQNEPEDHEHAHSHGTATWGASGGFAPGNLIGPAYGATFVLAKTEDIRSETQAEEDYYVAALEWADSLGVIVTSASLCYLCFDDGFCYEYEDKDGDTAVITVALDIAAARGITCVNCMGNYGCDTGSLGTPADADSMIAVGAVDSLNQIAYWSACGPTYDGRTKPEVVARGVDTYCADDDETDTYGHASGTSLSTPLVGGATALLLEAHPEWGPMDVREALMETADRADTPDNQYGWGRIDVEEALNWTPVLYPQPFSLLVPADSTLLQMFDPIFMWQASQDPDHGDPLLYTLWIDNVDDPAGSWSVEAGADTFLTLPFGLCPAATYCWEVSAEDLNGNRRYSRESFTFVTPDAASVPDVPSSQVPTGPVQLQVRCAPNPFADALRFRVETPVNTAGMHLPDGRLRWAVYDPLGRRIASGRAHGKDGIYEATWSGDIAGGEWAHPGVYYLEMRVGHRFARETIVRLPR